MNDTKIQKENPTNSEVEKTTINLKQNNNENSIDYSLLGKITTEASFNNKLIELLEEKKYQ
jgi:hypothetical protein